MNPSPLTLAARRAAQAAAVIGLLALGHAQADNITLYNTGQVTTAGADSEWTVSFGPTATSQNTPINATVGDVAWANFGLGSNPAFQWDTYGDGSADGGDAYLDYYTTFDLTNADPSTVTITGNYAVDNSLVDVLINGHSLGISDDGGSPNGGLIGFGSLTAFTISIDAAQDAWINPNGANELTFVTYNGGDPQGLIVQFTGGSYSEEVAVGGVPDGATTAWLLAAGISALVLAAPLSRRSPTRSAS